MSQKPSTIGRPARLYGRLQPLPGLELIVHDARQRAVMKSLITGAGGQLGTCLLEALRHSPDHQVIPTDLVPPDDSPIPYPTLDVTDAAAVEELVAREKPDRVFHLAAILSARGETNPQRSYGINQGGTYNVLEACRKHGVKQLIFTSTIAVYGPGVPHPTPDNVELTPTTMYGATKAAGEVLGGYYQHRYGLDFRGVRYPGIIGPTLPGGGTSDYALFMYVDGIRHGKYEAFCRPDTRIPLMYMPDAIRALLELSAAPREQLTRSIYNIAGFSPTAEEIAASVVRHVPGTDLTFAPDPQRQNILDSWPRALDDATAKRDWGWRAEFDLDGMSKHLIPQLRDLLKHR